MTAAAHIAAIRQDAATLARGTTMAAQIDCPQCGKLQAVSVRTNSKGVCYSALCSTNACLRFYAPDLIHPKQRAGIVYPQLRMEL